MRTIGVLAAAIAFAQPAAALAEVAADPALEGCERIQPGAPVPPVVYDRDPAEVPLEGTVAVSPPLFRADRLEPGTRLLCVLTVRSRRDRPATYRLEPGGLVGSRSPRAVVDFLAPDDPRAAATAAAWVQARPDRVRLPPRGVARVPVVVAVPPDPPRGGVYASIDVVSSVTRATAGDADVGIETRISVPFLLSVGGSGEPRFQLRRVRAPRLRWAGAPWTLTANLDNTGTLHATPSGRVRLRSPFGNTVHAIAITGLPLLPGGRQQVSARWAGVPWLGVYRYDVRIGTRGEPASETVARAEGWFIALPPWWVLVLAGAAVAAAAVARRRGRRDEAMPYGDRDDADGLDEPWDDAGQAP